VTQARFNQLIIVDAQSEDVVLQEEATIQWL